MNPSEKDSLSKMIKENNVEDNTVNIRNNKHSQHITNDINKFLALKKQFSRLAKTNKELFKRKAINECTFLNKNYNNILSKLLNDKLDLNILNKFIFLLKKVEDGELDQHTASYEIGKLLKSHYIDSKLGEGNNENENENKSIIKEISWQEYKTQNIKKD